MPILRPIAFSTKVALVSLGFYSMEAAAKVYFVTENKVQLSVTDDPVQSRCVVIATSGSFEIDTKACDSALSRIPINAPIHPFGTYMFPGGNGKYSEGICVYPSGTKPSASET